MKKRLFPTVTLFFLLIATSFASARAMTVNEVLKNLTSHANTVGDFTQEKTILVNSNRRVLKSSGTFIISTRGIVWNTLKPVRSVSTITDHQIILTNSNGRKSILDITANNDFSDFSVSFSSIFNGDLESLNENFYVSYRENSSGQWQISLLPKKENISSYMKKIELNGVNIKNDSRLDCVTVFQQNGEDIKYTLTNQQVKETLSDEEKYFFEAK